MRKPSDSVRKLARAIRVRLVEKCTPSEVGADSRLNDARELAVQLDGLADAYENARIPESKGK